MEPDSKAIASVSQALAPDDEFYDAEVVSGGEGFEPIDFEHYYGNIKQWTFETVFMPLARGGSEGYSRSPSGLADSRRNGLFKYR
jgi:hypothetical protein